MTWTLNDKSGCVEKLMATRMMAHFSEIRGSGFGFASLETFRTNACGVSWPVAAATGTLPLRYYSREPAILPSRLHFLAKWHYRCRPSGSSFGFPEWRSRRESNPDLKFRKPPFYPLNYGASW